jgi:transcriptional regulator with XRE-family HTH domain
MENESLGVFLGEKLRDKNISLERLSELSGITIKHLENLLKGEAENLPSSPYLHGYLLKLGELLDFDGKAFWEEWREYAIPSSGASDKLPKNRFSKKPVARYIWAGAATILFLIYLGFAIPRIIGSPSLSVGNPESDLINTTSSQILVSGTLQNAKELYINGEAIAIDPSGAWEKTVSLQSGLNTLQITAKKFLGGESKIIKQVFYEVPIATTSSPIL